MAEGLNRPLPASRSEARALGLQRYFTGKSCKHGHCLPRLTSTAHCIGCTRIAVKAKSLLPLAKAIRKRWELRNRNKRRSYVNGRRSRKAKAEGSHKHSEILELLASQDNLCVGLSCGKDINKDYSVDHKVPLSRGGSDWIENIQLLCGPCNSRKGTKTQSEWLSLINSEQESVMAKAKAESIASGYEYDTTKIRGKDGKVRSSRGNGDAVARAMLLFTAGGGEITTVINANKLQERMAPHLKKKGPKAAGLQRMTLGVMLRALVRNGTPVKIGKELIEKLTQKVDLPKVEKTERAAPKAKKAKAAAKPRKARKAKIDTVAQAA